MFVCGYWRVGVALLRSRFSVLFAGHVALLHSSHSSTAAASSAPRVRASARQPTGFQWAYFRGLKKAALKLKKADEDLCTLTQQWSGLWLGPLVWSATPPAAVGPEVFYCELLLQQQKRGQITNPLTLTPSLLTTQGCLLLLG